MSMAQENAKGSAFEWWMFSFIAAGAGWSAFISLLIPPYVTEATGDAANAGIVMAIISLAAVLGPVLGGFADRYRAHRLVLSLGVLGLAVGFVAYALSAESGAVLALDAILLGVSIAAVNAVGPVFVLGAGLPQALQAKRLTVLNLLQPVGQVIGGVIMTAAASLDFSTRFWLAAGVMLLSFVVTWFTSAAPAKRIVLQEEKAPADRAVDEQKKSYGLKQVLLSNFGLFLVILILSSAGNNGINAQIANILPNVYGMDQATTSGLISLAGLFNIGLFIMAGGWLARSGGMTVFTAGSVIRLVGALGMAVIGLMANAPILIAAAFMQILYQSNPFVRLTQPVVAMRFATIPAGQASGWVIAAAAAGSFLGSLIGGWLASGVGYNAINWMAAIAIGAAVLLLFVSLWPAERKKQAEEA